MRKILFLSAMAVCIGTASFSQITFKPTVGMNLTDVEIENGDAKGKAGVLIGASVEFGKKVFIEPGIQYLVKSSEINLTNNPNPEVKSTLSGIRVPLRVGINLLGNQASTFTLHGFGGVSGFFITAVSDNLDKDKLNTANWGVFAGAGVDIWKIFVDVSYEWSLSDVSKDVAAIQLGNTRSLFINAGLRLNFKQKKS